MTSFTYKMMIIRQEGDILVKEEEDSRLAQKFGNGNNEIKDNDLCTHPLFEAGCVEERGAADCCDVEP